LAATVQMKLLATGGDMLLGSGIKEHWQMHNRLATMLKKQDRPGGDRFGTMIAFIYRKTGLKFFFPRRGNSIYVHFQKL
jgi:hypothetical protein